MARKASEMAEELASRLRDIEGNTESNFRIEKVKDELLADIEKSTRLGNDILFALRNDLTRRIYASKENN